MPSSTQPTFHTFPQLPAELQNMVWKEALPGPRCVVIQEYRGSSGVCELEHSHPDDPEDVVFEMVMAQGSQQDDSKQVVGWYGPTAMPVDLQICQRSRALTLMVYKPMFPSASSPVSARIYFDPAIDTLFMSSSELLARFIRESHNIDQVKTLAISGPVCNHKTPTRVEAFKGLQTLIYAIPCKSSATLHRFVASKMQIWEIGMMSLECSSKITWGHDLIIDTSSFQRVMMDKYHTGSTYDYYVSILNTASKLNWTPAFVYPRANSGWHSRSWIEHELKKATKKLEEHDESSDTNILSRN